jgi:hypothetical protein
MAAVRPPPGAPLQLLAARYAVRLRGFRFAPLRAGTQVPARQIPLSFSGMKK